MFRPDVAVTLRSAAFAGTFHHHVQDALAKAIRVLETRISEIIHGKRRLTPDTALRLATFFQTSPDFWLGMQAECELRAARRKIEHRVLKNIRPYTELGWGEIIVVR